MRKCMVLFDIDGTLLYSGGAGSRAFIKAFELCLGIKNPFDGYHLSGKTDLQIIHDVIEKHLQREATSRDIECILKVYVKELERELERPELKFEVKPGVTKLLPRLLNEGVAVGLATGNIELGAKLKLRRGGIDKYFRFGGFGSDSRNRVELTKLAFERGKKVFGMPDLSYRSVFVIGDSPLDVAAAKGAGFSSIAVCTGFTPKEELQQAEPDFLLEDLSEVDKVVRLILDNSDD